MLDDPLAHSTVGEIASLAFAAESTVLQAGRWVDLAAVALYAVRDVTLTPARRIPVGTQVHCRPFGHPKAFRLTTDQ